MCCICWSPATDCFTQGRPRQTFPTPTPANARQRPPSRLPLVQSHHSGAKSHLHLLLEASLIGHLENLPGKHVERCVVLGAAPRTWGPWVDSLGAEAVSPSHLTIVGSEPLRVQDGPRSQLGNRQHDAYCISYIYIYIYTYVLYTLREGDTHTCSLYLPPSIALRLKSCPS